MKKVYLFGASSILSIGAIAQSMNENFDAYTAGSYMGVNSAAWTTWSGSVGGSEDCQVSTTQAASGTNSIYFVGSSSGGGPQDVVVPFGGAYNTGQFYFEAKFFIVTNKGAYFNFQGNTTLGQVWSLNCQMVQTGQMYVDDGAGHSINTTFPHNQWFTLALDINLNTNDWELLIDGVSQGILQNDYNQLASIDIYPVNASNGGNNQSGFYIDDFNFLHTPYALPAVNGAVTSLTNVDGIAGISLNPQVKIRNLGTTNITSFDLTIDYNGNQIVENITGVNIASLAYYTVDFSNAVNLVPGALNVTATISNVNGAGADNDAADDVKIVNINPVVPATGKVVVGEEGTGTWCQWCPRGAVYMDYMSDKYGDFFAGVAVHNNDPMAFDEYDVPMSAAIGSSYPGGLVDRVADVDPSAFEQAFLDRIVVAPKAILEVGAQYNSTTGLLEVSVTADFQQAISGNYRLACVITEDEVTGTGAGWSQSNAYAGGGNGVMGGFELLPNPVPASQMVYNHVARIILPGFDGLANSFPATVAAGEVHTINFNIDVPSNWDINELHIVGMLINPSGDIDNAGYASLAQAQANGFVSSTTVIGLNESIPQNQLNLYPNPAKDVTNLSLTNLNNANVSVKITDINGRLIEAKNYGILNGNLILPININYLEKGVYLVELVVNDNIEITRLVVE